METTTFLRNFAQKFSESLPPPLKELKGEFEKQFHEGLKIAFSKLTLVTREEFEIQTAVLSRTREKLQALEQRLSAIEAGIHESI